MHPFEGYFERHDHYPQLRFDDGRNRLIVEFAPGYLRIQSGQTSVWIRRSTALKMLKRMIPLARRWSRFPDHDVNQAMHEAWLFENQLLQEKRQEKKNRHFDLEGQERQKAQRYARAKARARRRAAEER